MGRQKGRGARVQQREAAKHREELERRFRDDGEEDASFAPLVTARQAKDEPYHRWLRYVQGFAPALVRRFVAEAGCVEGPVLDPFAGSGTVPVECARLGRSAIGLEAVPSLAFVANAPFLGEPPAWDDLPDASFEELRDRAAHPAQLAAVLLGAAATVDAEGHARSLDARPRDIVATRLAWMREDARVPLAARGWTIRADARRMPLADGVAGGALSSPPYISRYDYAKINSPMDRLHRGSGRRAARRQQVRAAAVLGRGRSEAVLPDAAEEAAGAFEAQGEAQLARMVRGYFQDLGAVLAQMFRVLRPGAPAWLVVGGADLKHVYIPSDLIVAEQGRDVGFSVDAVVQARQLRQNLRKLGDLARVTPRESVVKLRKPR